MKSEYGDRETVGSQIIDTHEKHLKSQSMEVGDLVNEFGKKYMEYLYDYVEEGSQYYDKFYVEILSRKTKLYMHRAIEMFPYITPNLPPMQENQDVFYIDCVDQKIELLWTLPDRSEFDLILANPDKDSEKLIEWIKIFKKGTKKKKIII